jgi:hypothetical protein
MSFPLRSLALSSFCFMGLLGSLFPGMAAAQPIQNQVQPMTKEVFTLSVKQAALTVCALRRLEMDYQIALKVSATPVFQLLKYQYGMGIVGIDKKLEEKPLIRYLAYKISELTLESCQGLLPSDVALTIKKTKSMLQP